MKSTLSTAANRWEKVEEALDRDRFMSPEEAQEFGIVDEVVEHRIPTDAETA